MPISGARWTALGLLVAALAALWQALKLANWGFDGPGPGLFPQILAVACSALAAAILLLPAGTNQPTADQGVERYDEAAPAERRTFHVYIGGLALLVAGTFFAGFMVTAFVVVLVLMRFGEGVSWPRSVGYAGACAAVGLLGFGWLLRVNLPEGWLDRAVLTLLR